MAFFEGVDEPALRNLRRPPLAQGPSFCGLCAALGCFAAAVGAVPGVAILAAVDVSDLALPRRLRPLARLLGRRRPPAAAPAGGRRGPPARDALQGDWCEGIWEIGGPGLHRDAWTRPCETGEGDEFARLRVRDSSWVVRVHECRADGAVVMDAQRNSFTILASTNVTAGFGLFLLRFDATTSALAHVARRVGACSLHCVVPVRGGAHWKRLPRAVHTAVALEDAECGAPIDARDVARCRTANETGSILELYGPCAFPEPDAAPSAPPPPPRRKRKRKARGDAL